MKICPHPLAFGSLRIRLILGIVGVHALLMTAVVFDLSLRQHASLRETRNATATSLSKSLAVSSAGWIAAQDRAGLQELVEALRPYPDLEYAMVVDASGKILAHTDPSRMGLYLQGMPSASESGQTRLIEFKETVEALAPAQLAGHLVGWCLLSFNEASFHQKFTHVIYSGIGYILVGIMLGSLMAVWVAHRFTAALDVLAQASDAVRSGQLNTRVPDLGNNEVGRLALGFNSMLDALSAAHRNLDAAVHERTQDLQLTLDELRTAKATLTENSTRLALATQVGGIGIWAWNVQADTLQWDATMRTLYGLPPEAPIEAYNTWAAALHPDDQVRCHQETRDALANLRPYDTEFQIIRPDGKPGHLRSRAIVQRDAEGHALAMVGVNWDITELKLSQERLQLFSRAVDQSPASVVITNTRGDIEYVNEKFTRLTGYTPAEVLGKNPRVLKSGETTAENYFELWAKISRGEVWTGVFHNLNKTGQLYWEAATITPIKNTTGQVTHYLASKEDITERRQAEAALRHERWLLNSLMATAPAHIYFKDGTGAFMQINHAFAQFLGVASTQEVIGLTDYDLFTAESADQSHKDEETVMLSGKPLIGKIERTTRRDGTSRWFSTSKMPLRNDAGILTGTFGFSLDVTDQKQSEEDRALLQIQLSQAQKLESIGMLAAGIAHEINTPAQFVSDNLTYVAKGVAKLEPALAAFPQLLAALQSAGPLSAEIEPWVAGTAHLKIEHLRRELPAALEDALNGMGRITQIVRAMKNFSHPGGDKLTPCDLNQAIDNTLIVCRNEWKYVADLKAEFAPELPLVPCLLGDFNQVIVNLVVNAAHAIGDVVNKNPSTKGTITIATRLLEGWAEVRVSDTGTGIPENVRAHIFTPFFTTKQVGRGTGQGLALARSVIAERHHGTLHFESELGRGTTFVIRLPLVTPVAHLAAPANPLPA